MDDPNITIEEYIRLEEEKASRRGKVYNWETAKYGKIVYDKDVHDLRSVENEFPAIVFNDALKPEVTLSCEPAVSPLNDNKIDFRMSFDESDDEDYTVIYDENSFPYKIIYVDKLKTDLENDNDKVNMPSFPSPEHEVSYSNDLDFFKDFENEFLTIVYNVALMSKSDFLTEHIVSPQHIDEFNNETSLSECEKEQNVLYFNDLFPFNVIYLDDLKSDTDNDNDKFDIEKPSGDMSIIPLPNVINVDTQGSNKLLETSINTAYLGEWIRRIDFLTLLKRKQQCWWSIYKSGNLECAGDAVDFRTWLGISLETTMMSTMDLDGVTCLTEIEEKRDTAYQRQVFTRKRVFTIPNMTYPPSAIRPSNCLERLPDGSITTWEDPTTRFLAQLFPSGRTAKLRNDILMFQQHQGESLLEAWTRFKICSGPHDTQYNMENPEQAFVEYASSCNDKARDDDLDIEEPKVGENAGTREYEVAYFDVFPTRNELAHDKYLMCGPIPSIFLRNPIIMEGCSSNIKIPCNIGHVHIEKAYIDPNSPLNIMTRMMYNWIMRRKLDPRENSDRGVSNFMGKVKGMHVFIGNFTYDMDFKIVEDISSIIDHILSQVVLGKPFVEISNMTHDTPEGVVMFINGTDEIAYKMPHKIEQYNLLSDLEKDHTKSVYIWNEEDKRRGVGYMMRKILGFYKECLELGPEYVTGMDDEGEVT
ncbi:retrotransposon ORF1 [Tanacetum coccineum]